jgi:hypothetical protein
VILALPLTSIVTWRSARRPAEMGHTSAFEPTRGRQVGALVRSRPRLLLATRV